MATPSQPRSGQVYRTPDGHPMIFVRTEKRPGEDEPQHLYVTTRGRAVFERWLPVDAPVPDELTLVHDPEATWHAQTVTEELETARAERAALLAVIRSALPMVPVVTATAMRAAYREAMPK